MQNIATKPEWLTLSEAARRAGRSYTWAWERAFGGLLERHPEGGQPIRVSAASLARVIAQERPTRIASARARKRPALRLIVDNTK
jgi:hypothetical protein